MQGNLPTSELYNRVISLLKNARNSVIRTVNHTMVITYYEIGKMIIEEEQKGNSKSDYGSNLIKNFTSVHLK